MKFAKHHKLLGNSNAEDAEKDAEKTNSGRSVFSALPLRSLRLRVEAQAPALDKSPSYT